MYLSYSYSVTHRHEHFKFIWLVPRCDLYTSCSSFSVQSRTCDFCNTIYYIIHNIILIRSVVTVNNDHWKTEFEVGNKPQNIELHITIIWCYVIQVHCFCCLMCFIIIMEYSLKTSDICIWALMMLILKMRR